MISRAVLMTCHDRAQDGRRAVTDGLDCPRDIVRDGERLILTEKAGHVVIAGNGEIRRFAVETSSPLRSEGCSGFSLRRSFRKAAGLFLTVPARRRPARQPPRVGAFRRRYMARDRRQLRSGGETECRITRPSGWMATRCRTCPESWRAPARSVRRVQIDSAGAQVERLQPGACRTVGKGEDAEAARPDRDDARWRQAQ